MKEALEIAIDYMNDRLEDHDVKYKRHPATEAERINILADIETVKEALSTKCVAQPEQERCVGCEACIDTACGRDECPKGWPKAVQPEQEPVPAAMKTVIEAMQQDPDYAWGWHCNIAMSFVDAGGDHYTGNQGAARFMRTLANVEPAHELPFSPPQRTWVGLTDEQIAKEVEAELTHYWNGEYIDTTGARDQLKAFARAIEAKLREKNSL